MHRMNIKITMCKFKTEEHKTVSGEVSTLVCGACVSALTVTSL